jgi:methylated-DNA-[protein]-cysteine S-methyltransferase
LPLTDIRIPKGRRAFSTVVKSPVGSLTMLAVDEGLVGLWFAATRLVDESVVDGAICLPDHPILRKTACRIEEYFSGGRKTFDVPLSIEGTDFQIAVWRELMNVSYGMTISYGALAARLGNPGKARAVGGAVGRNPVGILVPCHRVIGTGGQLTGFGGGVDVKAALLDLESRHS